MGAAARVLAHPGVSEADKERLRGLVAASDPVMLFTGIRVAQEELGRRVDRRGLNGELEKPFTIDLQRFTASLKTAWQAGETRPTHRRPYLARCPSVTEIMGVTDAAVEALGDRLGGVNQ